MNTMVTNSNEIIPFAATHPTEILRDEIEARGISSEELARLMGVGQKDVARLLDGEDITPGMAQKLESALGIPADSWMRMQSRYYVDLANIARREEVESLAMKAERTHSAAPVVSRPQQSVVANRGSQRV